MTNYIPLHLHTDFGSPMDGCANAEEYAAAAIKNGMSAVGITDHGSIAYHREFSRVMQANDLKPIFGMEAYICPDINDKRAKKDRKTPLDRIYNHLTIIAKNPTGYQNLSILSQKSWNEGFYHKPRIDFDMLSEHSEGLILGSACMAGLLNAAIEIGDLATAKQHLGTLRDIAGDDFYIELMPHNVNGINTALLSMADAYKIKTIVTPDCHHAHTGQKVLQEIMLAANTHPKTVTSEEYAAQVASLKLDGRMPDYSMLSKQDADAMLKLDKLYGPDRQMTFNKLDIHLLSDDEMVHGMGSDFRRESFDNTLEISEKVMPIAFPDNVDTLPHFDNSAKVLRDMCDKALIEMGLDNEPDYKRRLEEELKVIIDDKHFDPYFLMVNRVIEFANDNGIRVGPGRGSGAGCLVNYLLGHSKVDPVAHNLMFFRFIDPSRPDWPDFDMDFMDTRRDEIKQFIADEWGEAASIATYQRFSDKGMLKDIARVFGAPYGEVEAVAKQIERWDEYKTNPNIKEFRKKYPLIEIYGEQLRGRVRGTGIHASGVVASKLPLADIAPIETRSKVGAEDRQQVVAVDMEETESIGLIKLDILGLKALSKIDDTLVLIQLRTGEVIDIDSIPLDDPNVYMMLSRGETAAVFQCEQSPYTKLLMQMGVDDFDGLSVTNALVRPGAADTIGKEYLARRHGRKRAVPVHECMEPYTRDTEHLIVYQEQLMLLCVHLAGMSMVDANKVRKIAAKKKDPELLEVYKQMFIEGASKKIGQTEAALLWEDILKWSGYGFVKAHAVAYSMVSYQMAWLKLHYPLEFMVATLNNEQDRDSRTRYLIEAKRLGIKVLLPHVNTSSADYTIEGDAIRIGLASIKGLSQVSAQRFIDARPFSSYDALKDFTLAKGTGVTTAQLKALDSIGAADIGGHKATDVKANLYEYLNLPELSGAYPAKWNMHITKADEYDEDRAQIVAGIVTNVKRGRGWSLVTVMDETGDMSVFSDEDTTIAKGQSYILLCANKRIVDHVATADIDKSKAGVVKWLGKTKNKCAVGEYQIINFAGRTTKAGKKMATIVMSDTDDNLLSAVVWSDHYNTAWAKLKPGTVNRLKLKENRNGELVLEGIE